MLNDADETVIQRGVIDKEDAQHYMALLGSKRFDDPVRMRPHHRTVSREETEKKARRRGRDMDWRQHKLSAEKQSRLTKATGSTRRPIQYDSNKFQPGRAGGRRVQRGVFTCTGWIPT
eukprot:SAG22_NODE_13_length_33548_cov_57.167773_20_plen_118_part_00